MKNLLIIILLITLPVVGFAQTKKGSADHKRKCIEAQVITDDVKMYRQAATSSEILTSLKTSDEVLFLRKHNNHWAVVTVGDKAGYVLYGEITNRAVPTPTQPAIALQKKRK
ncbi:SH3 domain-containing protein [Rufibacter tibetensis]|nr:hypothetical protein [Rufibacter tibetensis]